MVIKKLDYEKYKGWKYQAEILSDRYLSIEPAGEGFDIGWVMSDKPLRMYINDTMLSDWLDHPTAYGAFEGDRLIVGPEKILKHLRYEGTEEVERLMSEEGKSCVLYAGHFFKMIKGLPPCSSTWKKPVASP